MGRRRQRPQGNPQLGVGYIRVSTARQDLGPEAQRQAIAEWARRHGVEVVSWHEDRGVSGGSEIHDRPELIAALASTKEHGAGVVVVARRDRLARDTLVAQLIERAVQEVGAQVVSADGVANGEDPASQMVRTILDAVSAYERAVIRLRIRGALAVKRKRLERVGSVPFGWRLAVDGQHLDRVDDEQVVIEAARQLREGGATFRAVARELARRGHHSRTGRIFDPQQVRRMVTEARS